MITASGFNLNNALIFSRLQSQVQITDPQPLHNSSNLCQKSMKIKLKMTNSELSGSAQRLQPESCLSIPYQSEVADLVEVDDDDTCPVDCVKEFNTDEEFFKILEKAKVNNSLVVVDFYRTSCGSCKYIEQGFVKLCKGSNGHEDPVIFLKHNVMDEYDEQSEVADRLRIKTVPLFQFYKDGTLVEAFPTRDKARILAAITKHTLPAVQ